MMRVTLEKPTISEIQIIRFPSPIQKDKYVSHTSLYDGSCNLCVNTNSLMHLSPKIFSTDVSILNNARWISKIVYFDT